MKIIKQTDKMLRNVSAVIILMMLMGILYVAGYFHKQDVHRRQFEQLREAARTDIPQMESAETEEIEETTEYAESLYDFETLQETNADIYAWITVPGTQIDYPVLQAAEDDYYLDHNLDHTTGYPGCIYTNSCNAKDFTDSLTVLYGHNMKNGSMFGCLHEFEEEIFFREHREILINTIEGQSDYEIIAATVFTDLYIPAFYGVNSEEGKENFITELEKAAESHAGSWFWNEEDEAGEEARYVILSTCINGADEQRYLLVGRMVEE